jgi:broad specificity phosphatase PhoE
MDDLIEVEMGEWDGRLVKDLFEQDGELLARWMRNPSSVTLPGGEDFNAVRARTESALAKLTERHAEGPPALVVSHGGPIRMMLCQTLRMDIDDMLRIEIELASISSIAFFPEGIDKSGIVTLTNDTSHLK